VSARDGGPSTVRGMDVQEIAPGLWHWTAKHPEWKPEDRGSGEGWDEIVSSYAVVTDDALVLIDPLVPGDEPDRFWEALDRDVDVHGPPAILITVFWHARSAQAIAERYPGTTIWAPADTPAEVAERLDSPNTYSAGETLPGGVRAHDVSRLGEMVLYLTSHNAVAFGDVVLDGVRLCPDSWLRNVMTRRDVAEALRPLLELDVDLLLLTHGGPVTDDARVKLEAALRT
jgi:glyoxylase-like metal-dependent hydrolase (beta-lactamase superfamily II)